jgi:hypothetical protein
LTQTLPSWVANKRAEEAAARAGAVKQMETLQSSALEAVRKTAAPSIAPLVLPKAKLLTPLPALPPPDESELKYVAEQKAKAAQVAAAPDDVTPEQAEAIKRYHKIAAQMAEERAASEEKERRQHELEIRRLELETAQANARAASATAPIVIVVPPPAQSPQPNTSLREVAAMEQQNEELRLFRLQIALEMARLRGEKVAIADYGIGAEQRRQAAAIARAMNDPDPLRRAKALRALGYSE